MKSEILFGKTTEHLVPLEGTKFFVHQQMLSDFLKLQQLAKDDGYDLQIASAFRDYDRQLKIWNAKAKGERPLLDDDERPLEYSQLSPQQIVNAILRWSAIPGCSRHHWGTDIDVFDGVTQKFEDVKLTPSECEGSGPAAEIHEWLDYVIEHGESFGFFRPYRLDKGGTSPERWHLSYRPLSQKMVDAYSFALFKNNISQSEIMFKEILLKNAEDIFQRFFLNFDPP